MVAPMSLFVSQIILCDGAGSWGYGSVAICFYLSRSPRQAILRDGFGSMACYLYRGHLQAGLRDGVGSMACDSVAICLYSSRMYRQAIPCDGVGSMACVSADICLGYLAVIFVLALTAWLAFQ